jgi:hypothetical protein
VNNTTPETRTLSDTTELRIGGNKLKLVVPANDVPPESLLPTLHELSNLIIEGVEQKIQKVGM